MRASQARMLFKELTETFFSGATVIFAQQSRIAKPSVPLITIAAGNVRRTQNPAYKVYGEVLVGGYQSRMTITVDLFTHGTPVTDDDGTIVAYENTAPDEMLAFADYLGSQYVIEWCNRNDVAVLIDGDIMDLTGLVNDNNYDYRSRLNVMFHFTQETVGHAAVLDESSIRYPTGENDKETGEPIYTADKPTSTESKSGTYSEEEDEPFILVVPEMIPSSAGGGSKELADLTTGYFNEVEIKEETGNE